MPTQTDLQLRNPRPTDPYVIPNQTPRLTLSLVIPTYNEADNLPRLIPAIVEQLNPILPNDYELIVVDDDSTDGTLKIAEKLSQLYPMHLIHRKEKGLATAILRGWQSAQGAVLGVIDADLQHDPRILQKMIYQLNVADLVVGSRHVRGGGVSDWSLTRRLTSRGAQYLASLLVPQTKQVSDPMSGYFLIKRDAIANIPLYPKGYKLLVEILGRTTIPRIAEVGYIFQERQDGESKVSWKHYLDYIQHLTRLSYSQQRFIMTERNLRACAFIFVLGICLRLITQLLVTLSPGLWPLAVFLLTGLTGFGLWQMTCLPKASMMYAARLFSFIAGMALVNLFF